MRVALDLLRAAPIRAQAKPDVFAPEAKLDVSRAGLRQCQAAASTPSRLAASTSLPLGASKQGVLEYLALYCGSANPIPVQPPALARCKDKNSVAIQLHQLLREYQACADNWRRNNPKSLQPQELTRALTPV
jgi:hypothetical protein